MPRYSGLGRWEWLLGSVWLVFMAWQFAFAWTAPVSDRARSATLAALVAFCVLYVFAFREDSHGKMTQRRALGYALAMLVAIAATIPVNGWQALGSLPYFIAMAVFTFSRRGAALVIAGSVVAIVVTSLSVGEPAVLAYLGPVLIVTMSTVFVGVLSARSKREAEVTQVASIARERDRVSRDVHDVLGHSLTAISAKAELAERLLAQDVDRARDEIAQIRSLARESLAQVRATVVGLRMARLVDEVATARESLGDAGIAATFPDSYGEVDPRHRIVLAWVLREAVTNVIRHSGATSVAVLWGSDWLSVSDDGVGIKQPEGNGLRGLRERVEEVGGTVEVRPTNPGVARPGATIRVSVGAP